MPIQIENVLNSIKGVIEKMSPRSRYISIGFIIGVFTPIAVQMFRKSLLKLQKARK